MGISSFSSVHKPEGYVQPFNLDLFGKVLQYKQSKYDAGVQQVQTLQNQTKTLPVIGDAPKQYLAQKLNEVTQDVNSMGGLDYSDSTVVNSVSGQIGNITNDPIIKNSIDSAVRIQKRQASWEKIKSDYAAGKKGVYFSEANYAADMDDIKDYLNQATNNPNASYRGTGEATPYKDYMKTMRSIAASQVASTITSTNADGSNSYMYITKTGQTVTPESLWNSVTKQLSTEDMAQINRDAKFNYIKKDNNGNLIPESLNYLSEEYNSSNNQHIKLLDNKIKYLESLSTQGGTSQEKEAVEQEINRLKDNILERKNQLNSLFSKNPEQAASTVYLNRLLEGIVSNYSYSKETEKPFWNQGQMHIDNLTQQKSIADQKLALDNAQLSLNAYKEGYNIKMTDNGIVILPNDSSKKSAQEESSLSFEKDDRTGDILKENENIENEKTQALMNYWNKKGIEHPEHFIVKQSSLAPGGKEYIPKKEFKNIYQNEINQLDAMSKGLPIPFSKLSPEFMEYYNKVKILNLTQLSNSTAVGEVNKEAFNKLSKEYNASEEDINNYTKGKLLAEKQIRTTQIGSSPMLGGIYGAEYKTPEYTKEQKKQLDAYYRLNEKIGKEKIENIVKEIWQNKSSRIKPVLINFSDKELKNEGLKTQVSNLINVRGYYSLDGDKKPEDTKGETYDPSNLNLLGKTRRDLGDGKRNYIKAHIKSKDSNEQEIISTVYVPVDDTMSNQFGEFKIGPDQALVNVLNQNHEYSEYSYSRKGDFSLKYRIFKADPNDLNSDARISVEVPVKDEKGNVKSTRKVTIPGSIPPQQAYTFAESIAESYNVAKESAKKSGINLTFNQYIDSISN